MHFRRIIKFQEFLVGLSSLLEIFVQVLTNNFNLRNFKSIFNHQCLYAIHYEYSSAIKKRENNKSLDISLYQVPFLLNEDRQIY